MSRNDLDLGGRYPEIREALAAQDADRFAVDGEIVAFEGSRTSFAALAQRGRRPAAVFYYVFDLLWLDGYDIRALDLRSRKRLLRTALTFAEPLRLTSHRNRDGEAMFTEACRKGWEGVAAKRADSPYREARSHDWLADPSVIRERGVHWVEPELVAQVGFTEWTRAGRLRHPRFLGLRDDSRPSRWCASSE
jgi:bifunctional non-homologous end joining protein LigD